MKFFIKGNWLNEAPVYALGLLSNRPKHYYHYHFIVDPKAEAFKRNSSKGEEIKNTTQRFLGICSAKDCLLLSIIFI